MDHSEQTISAEEFKRLFAELLDLAPDERSARLEAIRARDTDAHRRMVGLLAAHDNAGEFLAEPTRGGTLGRMLDEERPEYQIGPYRLVERLGEGGFAVVWSATQEEPVKREVALKILKPGMESRQILARFEAERQTLAVLNHPSIARVLDAGVTPRGRSFFAMELVEGRPLTTYCDEHRLSVDARLRLLASVCDAVQHAHQKGIVHRDLKPSNILVREVDGKPLPVIIDFGIAKAIESPLTEATAITEMQQIVGTPQYMSPEQAGMDTARIDTRTDVYSLGVLLHELLAGASPYDVERLRSASFAEVGRIVRESRPSKPSTRFLSLGEARDKVAALRQSEPQRLARELRGDLDWIVLRATQKDPDRRYSTAYALAADLRRHLAHEPVSAGPPSRAYHLAKFARRHRVAVGFAGVALAAVLGGLGLALYGLGEATRLRGMAEDALDAETERLQESLLSQARAHTAGSMPGRRQRALSAVSQAAAVEPSLALRNVAIAALAQDDVRREVLPALGARAIAWGMTDASRAIVQNEDGSLRVVGLPDGRGLATIPPVEDRFFHGVLSADGALAALVYTRHDRASLRVFDVGSGEFLCTLAGGERAPFDMEFGSDNTWLQFAVARDRVEARSLPTGELLARAALSENGVRPRVVPGRRRILFSPGEDTASIWDIDRDEIVREYGAPSPIVSLSASPDAVQIAMGCEDRRLYVFDGASGEELVQLTGHQGMPIRIQLDGETLVSAAWDNTVRFWNVRLGGAVVDPIEGQPAASLGRALLTSDRDRMARWSYEPSPVYSTVVAETAFGVNSECSFSPDGSWFITAGANGVRTWDTATGRLLGVLSTDNANGASIDRVSGRALVALQDRAEVWTLESPNQVTDRVSLITAEANDCWAAPMGDGERVVVVVPSGVHVFRQADGHELAHLPGYFGLAERPSASSDGAMIFTGNWRGPAGRVWDLASGEVVKEFPGGHVTGAFSPTDQALVVGDGDRFTCYDTGTWAERWSCDREWLDSLSGVVGFSPDGSYVVLGHSRHTVRLVDARTGDELATLAGPDMLELNDATVSPDGSELMLTTVDRAVERWDLLELQEQLRAVGSGLDPWEKRR